MSSGVLGGPGVGLVRSPAVRVAAVLSWVVWAPLGGRRCQDFLGGVAGGVGGGAGPWEAEVSSGPTLFRRGVHSPSAPRRREFTLCGIALAFRLKIAASTERAAASFSELGEPQWVGDVYTNRLKEQ